MILMQGKERFFQIFHLPSNATICEEGPHSVINIWGLPVLVITMPLDTIIAVASGEFYDQSHHANEAS